MQIKLRADTLNEESAIDEIVYGLSEEKFRIVEGKP